MNILMAINDNYVEQAMVLFRSLYDHYIDKVNVFIMDSELSFQNKKKIKVSLGRYGYVTKFVFVDKKIFMNAPKRENISIETYFRLLAFVLLPEVEKILYLDADIIINDSIEELWNIDMDNYCIAGVADQGTVQEDMYHRALWGMKKTSTYINGGVLIMNLVNIRKKISLNMLLDYMDRMRGKLKYQDQDIINVIFENDILYLPQKYNYTPIYQSKKDFVLSCFPLQKKIKPSIIHYMGDMKPWYDYYGYKYFKEYKKYCRKTRGVKLKKRIERNNIRRPISLVFQFYRETFWW